VTTAAVARNRKARVRAVREEQARIRHAAVASIRSDIERARARRRELLGRVRVQCKAARARVQAAVALRRAEVREALNRELAEMRQADANRCALRKARVNVETETALERKRRQLREQRETEALVRRVESHKKKTERRHVAAERRAESDDAVRSNLEAELVPVFDRVRSKIRARPGMSRTEAFLHWVEEHPDEVWALREREAEAALAAMVREERRRVVEARRAERAVRACGGKCQHPPRPPKKARPRLTAAELAAIPF
jgi:hypothetical protein